MRKWPSVESRQQSFARLRLPEKDAADLHGFLGDLTAYKQALLAWIHSGLANTGAQFVAATQTSNPYADRLRADLGLPPTSPN